MTSFWWQHNNRASVRNFGDNCFYSDTDFKRYNRARYGSIWSGCGCCCNTGWRPSLRLGNFGCFGGWRGLNISTFKGGLGYGAGLALGGVAMLGIDLLGGLFIDGLASGDWFKRKKVKPEKEENGKDVEARETKDPEGTPDKKTKPEKVLNKDLEKYTELNKKANALLAKADVTKEEIASLIHEIGAVSHKNLLDDVQNDLDNENYDELLDRLNAKLRELVDKSKEVQPPGNDDNGSTPKEDLTTKVNTLLNNENATAEEIQGLIDEINNLPNEEKSKYQDLLAQLETKLGKLNKPDNNEQETVEEGDDATTDDGNAEKTSNKEQLTPLTDGYSNYGDYVQYDGKAFNGAKLKLAIDIEGRKTGIRDVEDLDGAEIEKASDGDHPKTITLFDKDIKRNIVYEYVEQDSEGNYVYQDTTTSGATQKYLLMYNSDKDEYVLVQYNNMDGSGRCAHTIKKG